MRGMRQSCGFTARQLLETRIVRHEEPIFYEVWVFSDNAVQASGPARRDPLAGPRGGQLSSATAVAARRRIRRR